MTRRSPWFALPLLLVGLAPATAGAQPSAPAPRGPAAPQSQLGAPAPRTEGPQRLRLELDRVEGELGRLGHPVGMMSWGISLFIAGSTAGVGLGVMAALLGSLSGPSSSQGGWIAGGVAAGAVGLGGLVLTIVAIALWVDVDQRRGPLLRRRDELRRQLGGGVALHADERGIGLAF